MSDRQMGLDYYKRIIDGLVRIRADVDARRLRERAGFPERPENEAINQMLSQASESQINVLMDLIQRARDGGIHDTLAFLGDEMKLNGLRLVQNGVELPVDPFGSELYYDWVCRCEGDTWPRPDAKQPPGQDE